MQLDWSSIVEAKLSEESLDINAANAAAHSFIEEMLTESKAQIGTEHSPAQMQMLSAEQVQIELYASKVLAARSSRVTKSRQTAESFWFHSSDLVTLFKN